MKRNRPAPAAGLLSATSQERKGIMKLHTDKGEITISSEVFTHITGAAATNCYGVKGMAIR